MKDCPLRKLESGEYALEGTDFKSCETTFLREFAVFFGVNEAILIDFIGATSMPNMGSSYNGYMWSDWSNSEIADTLKFLSENQVRNAAMCLSGWGVLEMEIADLGFGERILRRINYDSLVILFQEDEGDE